MKRVASSVQVSAYCEDCSWEWGMARKRRAPLAGTLDDASRAQSNALNHAKRFGHRTRVDRSVCYDRRSVPLRMLRGTELAAAMGLATETRAAS
jgi:hypothetical protein